MTKTKASMLQPEAAEFGQYWFNPGDQPQTKRPREAQTPRGAKVVERKRQTKRPPKRAPRQAGVAGRKARLRQESGISSKTVLKPRDRVSSPHR